MSEIQKSLLSAIIILSFYTILALAYAIVNKKLVSLMLGSGRTNFESKGLIKKIFIGYIKAIFSREGFNIKSDIILIILTLLALVPFMAMPFYGPEFINFYEVSPQIITGKISLVFVLTALWLYRLVLFILEVDKPTNSIYRKYNIVYATLPLFVSMMLVLISYKTSSVGEVLDLQIGSIQNWGIGRIPITFIIFFVSVSMIFENGPFNNGSVNSSNHNIVTGQDRLDHLMLNVSKIFNKIGWYSILVIVFLGGHNLLPGIEAIISDSYTLPLEIITFAIKFLMVAIFMELFNLSLAKVNLKHYQQLIGNIFIPATIMYFIIKLGLWGWK